MVFDALTAAKARGSDIVIIDTAGRLHNKANLMNELAKIRRIITRELPDADVETLMVIDATTARTASYRPSSSQTPRTSRASCSPNSTAPQGAA